MTTTPDFSPQPTPVGRFSSHVRLVCSSHGAAFKAPGNGLPLFRARGGAVSFSSQTSGTWQPRPLPPRPGSVNQLNVSFPSRVAASNQIKGVNP
jgi:hypothetical protein